MSIAVSGSLQAGDAVAQIKLPDAIFPIQNFTSTRDPWMIQGLALADGMEMEAIVVIDMTSISDDVITYA